jgi:hypothetical protein
MRRADSPASEASRKGRPDALHGLERRQLLVENAPYSRDFHRNLKAFSKHYPPPLMMQL